MIGDAIMVSQSVDDRVGLRKTKGHRDIRSTSGDGAHRAGIG